MISEFVWYCENCGCEVSSPREHSLLYPSHTYTKRMRWEGGKIDFISAVLRNYISTISGSLQNNIEVLQNNVEGNIPYITQSPYKLLVETSGNLVLTGINFRPDTLLDIPNWEGTLSNIVVNSPTEISFDYETGETPAIYDVIVKNKVANTFWEGNGEDLIAVIKNTWKDLRLNGDVFTQGNDVGNDIRYKLGMSMSRDEKGMYFTGANPWKSWVKFESLAWTRGENKTIEWIFTPALNEMMIGIGSNETDEKSSNQYNQMEVEAYFISSTKFRELKGNNGTPGKSGKQECKVTMKEQVCLKIKFTNDGTASESRFTLYSLPGTDFVYWDDESTILQSVIVGGTLAPDAEHIMPSIIPREDSQRFIAVRVS